jgi:hypothetical protein
MMTAVLHATFVRTRGGRDRVYVTRADATTLGWEFPTYGDGLPHDLCHLVVEDALGLSDGFWGLVDHHVDVRLIDNQATLVRNGRPLVDEPGFDFSGLRRAEEAVALLAPALLAVDHDGPIAVVRAAQPSAGTAPPATPSIDDLARQLGCARPEGVTDAAVAAITDRLQELGHRWRTLDDGAAITLGFAVPDS